jgi:hypothetical protein
LLQSPKLVFQASENSTNFCVDTRNQEQPILLRFGRKATLDLSGMLLLDFWLRCLASRWFPKIQKNHLNSSFQNSILS